MIEPRLKTYQSQRNPNSRPPHAAEREPCECDSSSVRALQKCVVRNQLLIANSDRRAAVYAVPNLGVIFTGHNYLSDAIGRIKRASRHSVATIPGFDDETFVPTACGSEQLFFRRNVFIRRPHNLVRASRGNQLLETVNRTKGLRCVPVPAR